ncbi:MAG: peptidase C39 family protein [Oscillospiraceae bacterium]|nr:peptidase C39 family protein [Oscillospiraceae bacterium]
MKRFVSFIIGLATVFSLAGGGLEDQSTADYGGEHKIPYPPGIVLEGSAGVEGQFDVQGAPYYPSLDFYNMKSGGGLTILENFKTYQQTTEFTCGPACLVMLLEYYNMYEGQGDREWYELRENKEYPETMLKDLIIMLESIGDWDIYSTYDLDDWSVLPNDLIINSLRDGKPIIFGDDDWGGHWRIIIGYDDMGDDIEANDVLIIADPYDTTDHNQDGYTIISFQRLYYNWSNRFDPDFSHNLFLIASPK